MSDNMERSVTRAITAAYFRKLESAFDLDVALVGAGPSALVAATGLARAGWRTAIFERALAPGGGVWGGGMLFNEVVVQDDALSILDEFGIGHVPAGAGLHTADSVELAAGLIFGARRAGATIFNSVTVEDIVFKEGRVGGLVINWTPVTRLGMHVDPLVVSARAVVDGTGHPSEIIRLATQKAGIRIDTPSGGLMGERPMWVEQGEASTVENSRCLYPGLYASGMAANNASGGFRMGPIFGGMLKSGRKIAALIAEDLRA